MYENNYNGDYNANANENANNRQGYAGGFNEYNNTPAANVKKQRGSGSRIIAAAICCSLLGGAVGAGGMFAGIKYFSPAQSTSVSTKSEESGKSTTLLTSDRKNVVNTASADAGTLMTASQVYEQNVHSTVGITTEINQTNYFGYQTTAAASGSGFIISADGYILTNHHVIEGASTITVTDYDGKTYKAELIGSDSSNDIAVLKIDADGLTPVVLGSSDNLKVGDEVAAIGNPLGELTVSLTQGVVSALDREVTTENATMNLIQTDCAINSGNSGGALFNMWGQVVGITSAKLVSTSYDNIGFAIPIDSIKDIVTSIIEKGYVTKPYIGIGVEDVSEDATGYGIPSGAAVKSVTKGAPAEKAGLKEGDVIVAADGKEIKGSSDLIAAVKTKAADDKLELKVYRQGEYVDVTVKVEEKKQDDTSDEETEQNAQQNGLGGQPGEGFEDYGFGDFGDFPGMFGY
ncbi:MAG: trypsin-like peptidase domain-containing protein [Ruminococcus sp.]|nr:trypsin-like peptidase domain-containing protein [Ruminococcus sp.]